jgi:hypothetical protein
MTRNLTPYGRRPYSCVLTWASESSARQPSPEEREGGGAHCRRWRIRWLNTILDPIACWRMKLLERDNGEGVSGAPRLMCVVNVPKDTRIGCQACDSDINVVVDLEHLLLI